MGGLDIHFVLYYEVNVLSYGLRFLIIIISIAYNYFHITVYIHVVSHLHKFMISRLSFT